MRHPLVVATGIDPDAGIAGNTRRLIDQAATGMFHTRVSPGVIVGRPEKQSIDAAMSGREVTGLPALIDARSFEHLPDLPVFDLPMARMASASFAPDSWHGLFDLGDGVNPDLIAKTSKVLTIFVCSWGTIRIRNRLTAFHAGHG
ncbi:MAG: hypothetical protein R2845_00045 [Thermomicrobiales bacterium]